MSKPHSLQSIRRVPKSKKQAFEELGPIAKRHGRFEKGTVLPDTQVIACPRVRVADLPEEFIPKKYYEKNLEQNQLLSHCCRHPEDHDIEARKSHPEEESPDIYIFYCTCGRKHVRWLCGTTDDVARPVWNAE